MFALLISSSAYPRSGFESVADGRSTLLFSVLVVGCMCVCFCVRMYAYAFGGVCMRVLLGAWVRVLLLACEYVLCIDQG